MEKKYITRAKTIFYNCTARATYPASAISNLCDFVPDID